MGQGFPKGNVPWNRGKGKQECEPTEIPTQIDIAWAAGIYEGEGTCQSRVCYRKNRISTYRAYTCSVSQKDRWLCDRMKALFGGSIRTIVLKNRTVLYPDGNAVYHRWDLFGNRALDFLLTIYRFLSPRRKEQVSELLNFSRRQDVGFQPHGCSPINEDLLQPQNIKTV